MLFMMLRQCYGIGLASLTDGIKSENICWIIRGLPVGGAHNVFYPKNFFVFSRCR